MIQKVPKKSKFWKCSCFLTDFGEIVLLSLKICFHWFFCKKVSPPTDSTLTLKKQVFGVRNSWRIDHLDRHHQCKFIFVFFYEISENRSKTLNFVTYRPKNDDSTSWKIDEIHENLGKSMKFSCFWQILEKSYCCRWRYFSLMFRKKVSPPVDPTLTLKKTGVWSTKFVKNRSFRSTPPV